MAEDAQVLRVIEDWCDRRDRGELVSEDELIQSHPEIADELRAHLIALEALDGLEAAQAGLPDGTPREIGDYKIVREVGRGGMGVVYEAVQQSLGRRVALKVLSLTITGSPQAVKRFQRESKAAAKLHHTNIVPIYGAGQHAGHWYYAMELVEGRALDEVVKDLRDSRRKPTESKLARSAREMSASEAWSAATSGQQGYFVRVAEMFAGVADALHAAHTAKVLHRDVKPSNLMLDGDGTLKLVDFGLAHVDGADASMTATGDLLGTPAYMSPEQAMAKRIRLDARTDVYSLGATLYEVLTLRPPFRATDLPGLCAQILSKDPVPARRLDPKLPKDLETIVMKAMEKDRDKRYANAGDFARDLRRFADGMAVHARRVNIAGRAWRKIKRHRVRSALAAAALLAVGAGVLLAARASDEQRRRRESDYERLIQEGQLLIARVFEGSERSTAAREKFEQAIELMPGRPDAYWMAMMSFGGRGDEHPMFAVERARENGLSRRTYHAIRACAFSHWRDAEATAREQQAIQRCDAAGDPVATVDRYYAARTLRNLGQNEKAAAQLSALLGEQDLPLIVVTAARGLRAKIREKRHDFAAALEDLLALRTLAGDSSILGLRIAHAWRALGENTKAQRELAQFFAGMADASEEHWTRACDTSFPHAPWLGQVSKAALEKFPAAIAALRARGMYLRRRAKYSESEVILRRALELAADSSPELRCSVRGNLVLTLLDLRRFDEVIATCREGLQDLAETRLMPGDAAYHRGFLHAQCGDALRELERYDEAITEYEKAQQRNPANWRARFGIASTLAAMGQPEKAIAHTKLLCADSPTNAALHLGVAQLHARLNRNDDAVGYARAAVRMAPRDAYLLGSASYVVHRSGHIEESLELAERALHEDGQNQKALGIKFHALLLLERLDDALLTLDQMHQSNPTAESHRRRGDLLKAMGSVSDSRKAYEAGLALDGKNTFILCNLGGLLNDLVKDHAAALALFDQLAKLEPWSASAHLNRGNALRDLGRHADAVRAYTQACSVDLGIKARGDRRIEYVCWARAHIFVAAEHSALGDETATNAAHSRAVELALELAGSDSPLDRAAQAELCDRGRNRTTRPAPFWVAHALELFRRGKYADSAYATDRATEGTLTPRLQRIAAFVGAMAASRTGNPEEARELYDTGIELSKGAPADDLVAKLKAEAADLIGVK